MVCIGLEFKYRMFCPEKRAWVRFNRVFQIVVRGGHSVHWGINPPSKTPPPLSSKAPLKSENCPSPRFLGSFPLSFFFLRPPPPPPPPKIFGCSGGLPPIPQVGKTLFKGEGVNYSKYKVSKNISRLG